MLTGTVWGGVLGSGGGATTPPRHGLIGWPSMSDGEGCAWGGGISKYKDFKNFFLMTIADSPLMGQSASGLNFNDVSGPPSFFPPLAG